MIRWILTCCVRRCCCCGGRIGAHFLSLVARAVESSRPISQNGVVNENGLEYDDAGKIEQSKPALMLQPSLTVDETTETPTRDTIDADIVSNRNELDRVINDPTAEPTIWKLKYLQHCTNDFTSKVLGEGAFGKVYFGCDKVLGQYFAVKRVPLVVPDQDVLEQITLSFKREVSVRTIFSVEIPCIILCRCFLFVICL
jgi:hypothetical protein